VGSGIGRLEGDQRRHHMDEHARDDRDALRDPRSLGPDQRDERQTNATNVLYHGSLTASKVVGSGDTFKFTSGNLTVTLD
jgi:hypothetical protein